nr:chromate transporter [Paenibacillus sp. DMB20]
MRLLNEVWWTALKLGATSFGGPVAHLGYFHDTYVKRKKWMDERTYAELVALCQFLPGPASSQVGIGIGIRRAGMIGGLVAWLGFTLPSVLLLIAFAYILRGVDASAQGFVQGLKLVAVAVVAQAVLGMGNKLASGRVRAGMAVGCMALVLLWQTPWVQAASIAASGMAGWLLFREEKETPAIEDKPLIGRRTGFACLALFAVLLAGLPLLTEWTGGNPWISLIDSFYRTGSLVFGGGHVVLPLLETETVAKGWISHEDFVAGYGATQAVPGPLFTFAAYLGVLIQGIPGAVLAILAIFLPGFLLVAGAMPFWSGLTGNKALQGAIAGMNAAVVGILFAALYDPIWTSSVHTPLDFALAAVLFVMLAIWKLPPWAVVLAGAIAGQLLF